jgi:aspartyl-tRNA(Asn)/glutamyl-tRNA(Gln) amidotransferase subunit C
MSLDKATVAKIAHLARIKVPDDQLDALAGELNGILGWIEQLGEVATDNVEPMSSVVHHGLRRRADQVTDGGMPDKIVANAPDASDHFFTVPKVVE